CREVVQRHLAPVRPGRGGAQAHHLGDGRHHLGRPDHGRVEFVRHLEGQGEAGGGEAGDRVGYLLDHDVLPAGALWGQLSLPPARRFARSDLTVWIGMAKPRPMLPASEEPEDDRELALYIAELMPMMLPAASISAPPELPGLSEASVWIALYVVVE